jgi:predicted nucleotidyltransferase
LVFAGRELSTKAAAEVAGVSAAHASRVLSHLTALGVVKRRDVPPTALYSFATGSAVGQMLDGLRNLKSAVYAEMARLATEMSPRPIEVIVFGSVARGEDTAESDIDVVLVAPAGALDTNAWAASVIEWTDKVSTFASSVVEVVEVDESDWRGRPSDDRFHIEVARDGITVYSQVGVVVWLSAQ